MLYFLIFMLAYLFAILIILVAIDSLTDNYPKHTEDRLFLYRIYGGNQAWHKSVDGSEETTRVRHSSDFSIAQGGREFREINRRCGSETSKRAVRETRTNSMGGQPCRESARRAPQPAAVSRVTASGCGNDPW